MKAYDDMAYHLDAEHLVKILCEKVNNDDPLFFRVLVAYYMALVASMMRATVNTLDRGPIPINMYAINLSVSGAGKGHSVNVMEDQVIDQFRHNFTQSTLDLLAAQNLPKLALERATRKQSDPDTELALVQAEYDGIGPLLFAFDAATGAALRDVRHKLLMANGGALNLQIDEIGTNLTSVAEALGPYLELYDVGKIKQKYTKNTSDNKRREEIEGRTPANLLAFGTPTRLLNGGKTEEEFYAFLDTGYSRRCLFGYCRSHQHKLNLTPKETLDQRIAGNSDTFIEAMSDRLGDLADISQTHRAIQMTEPVSLLLIEYEQDCLQRALRLGEHDELRKAELSHRYFKVLKLAGAYAFIDGTSEVTEEHLYAAIKLVEDSGRAFDALLTRDRPYVKLAKYLAEVRRPVTQADLVEDLPFYKGAAATKNEMMQLAIAHGYQNNIIIKKAFSDGVEFISGETLQKTDLNDIYFSYSTDIAQGYAKEAKPVAFSDLHKMTQAQGIHWCNHAFKDGHRNEDNAIPGFNLLVLDVDHGVNLSTAKLLLEKYRALYYTTKRHTDVDNRFRILLPINYTLQMDAKDYKEFMKNLFAWLPFDVDEATGQRARKWLSHNGHYEYTDGEVLDILPFIPKTSKNEAFRSQVLDQQGMDNLERWVLNNSGEGNRNNMLHRYARILIDAGFDFEGVRQRVVSLNDKMPDKMDEAEILGTVMVTAGKAIAAR